MNMETTSEILEMLHSNPKGIRFNDLARICDKYFGKPRQRGASHLVYRMPWRGDPRVNIQNDRGMAKAYQVVGHNSYREIGVHGMKDHYTYRVTWSADDGEYVGLCAEFSSLIWLAPTLDGAFSGIRQLVSDCLADMRATNETPPEPIADRTYSGKFMVRVPPETHRSLATRAAEEGVSLNRLVSARLARDDR